MTDLEKLAEHAHAMAATALTLSESDLWAAMAANIDDYLTSHGPDDTGLFDIEPKP